MGCYTLKRLLFVIFLTHAAQAFASCLTDIEIEARLQSPPRHIPAAMKFDVEDGQIDFETLQRNYARFILKVGINLQFGGKIFIHGNAEHFFSKGGEKSFVTILEEEAYEMGASLVYRDPTFADANSARIRNTLSEADLAVVDAIVSNKYDHIGETKADWNRISLGPTEEFDTTGMTEEDAARRTGLYEKGLNAAMEKFWNRIESDSIPWIVVAIPTFEYAQRLFAHTTDAPIVKLYRAWQVYMRVMGLDRKNPVAYWQTLNTKAQHRTKVLNALRPSTLYFKSKDGKTNLSVGIVQECGWECVADAKANDKLPMMPNAPSVESWTSPHKMKVNGTLECTRPVLIHGKYIEGLKLVFKDGEVIEFDAKTNLETVRALFENNPAMKRAGEIALVSKDSPLNLEDLVFFTTLFDENTTIHLALGAAYPMGLKHLSKEQQGDAGLNITDDHIDVMFGSDQMDVWGDTTEGHIQIFENGAYTSRFDQPK
jgi:aminopeptidase